MLSLFSTLLLAWTVLLGACLAENHALLVGVSEYPNMDKGQWLVGPENDVALVSEVLTKKRFGFKKNRIVTLTGWPKDSAKRPTRSNISKAYAELSRNAAKGDTVFILMSGHGSQQPADEDPLDIETDGLDEIFLPADIKALPAEMRIENAIVDDEIKLWVNRIRDKGAFVWVVFDSCHSGTMTRGTEQSGRKNRHLALTDILGDVVLKDAKAAPVVTSLVEPNQDLHVEKTNPKRGGLVAMYAAQSLEPTFELPIPPPHGPRRGLFTTILMEVLSSSSERFSYRDLAAAVDAVYLSNGIMQPTPLVEGNGLDQPVFGGTTAAERPDALLTGLYSPDTGFEMDAGHLLGMSGGTILEVFPPAVAEDSEKALGTVQVVKVDATRSFVSPIAWDGHDAAPAAMLGSACRLRILYQNLGLSTLTVAVQEQVGDRLVTLDPDGKSTSAVSPSKAAAKVIAKLRSSAAGRYKLTGDPEVADWFLQLDKKGAGKLSAATGFSKTLDGPGAPASQSFHRSDPTTLSGDPEPDRSSATTTPDRWDVEQSECSSTFSGTYSVFSSGRICGNPSSFLQSGKNAESRRRDRLPHRE